ncbi:MAG: hypothetical protein JWR15_3800 [Prosthecobacter sp.]|nr:hypothetical protein [Prosthecobacter sp.]
MRWLKTNVQEAEPLNPYATPQARLINPDAEAARRPASVKWTTFVFVIFTLAMAVFYDQIVSTHGMQKLWREQSIILSLLLPFGLSFSLFGGRRKIAYYVNAGVLAAVATKLSWNTFVFRWGHKEAWVQMFIFDRCMEAFWLFLIWFLFYRFTFGLPSLRYFGRADA